MVAAVAVILTFLAGCQSPSALKEAADDGRVKVIATTGIIGDIVEQIGGDTIDLNTLVPPGADPHSYEPTLRDVRDIVYADVAFSNYAMLEEHALIRNLDSNLPPTAANVGLAEAAEKYDANVIPLVENVSLDTIWLGMRVRGTGVQYGADRASQVFIEATDWSGPKGSSIHAFLTEAFGRPLSYFDSTDGMDPDEDQASLPANAHTHLSWAFSDPGVYTLDLRSVVKPREDSPEQVVAEQTFTFVVGQDPRQITAFDDWDVLDQGHADLTADLDESSMYVFADEEGGGDQSQITMDADTTVIGVNNNAWREIPSGPQFRFLGDKGTQTYLLAQAVLGKHVHGEIDPHLWQDVRNGIAYAEVVRDTLIEADPDHEDVYRARGDDYIEQLRDVDDYVHKTIASIPEKNRHLVTTHDAFGYLGEAYDMRIAGFVTPNPAVEPSVSDRIRLGDTIRNLQVPAVFLEPNLKSRSSTLEEVAGEEGIKVCPIYGDSFDRDVTTYADMMTFNADSLKECLT